MLFGHRSRPNFVLLLSQQFKSGDFVFMQANASCSAHRAKATQDDLRNVVPDFAVERRLAALQQSQNMMYKPYSDLCTSIAHLTFWQLSPFSVERLLTFLITWCFFCILTCTTTLFSILVKIRNINMDFWEYINRRSLTENMYLDWFISA